MAPHARGPSRPDARLLTGVLADVSVGQFEALGHMGPVTHPDIVNDAVAEFLAHGRAAEAHERSAYAHALSTNAGG